MKLRTVGGLRPEAALIGVACVVYLVAFSIGWWIADLVNPDGVSAWDDPFDGRDEDWGGR